MNTELPMRLRLKTTRIQVFLTREAPLYQKIPAEKEQQPREQKGEDQTIRGSVQTSQIYYVILLIFKTIIEKRWT